MSKVKIEGNASGTGTLTISAPNTDTDRALTLPDGAGEILTSASTLSSSNLSGALPAIDGSALTGISGGGLTPAWSVTNTSNQSLSDDVLTRVVFDSEILDTDSAFASNVFTVPTGEGGKYFIGFRVFVDDIDSLDYCMAYCEVNGVWEGGIDQLTAHTSTTNVQLHTNALIDLSAGDVVEVVCKIVGAGTQELRSGEENTQFYGWKVA